MRARTRARSPAAASLGAVLAAALMVVAVLAVLGARPAPAGAAATVAAQNAAQQLADKYSPIVMVRKQTDGICDSSEEQYWPPTSVYTVLDNPRVKLFSRVGRKDILLKRDPSAADVAGRPEGVYLDLPGQPRSPGCGYSRDFNALRKAGRAPAITYAHIAREPGHPGFALQYWFFYYFNDFNDLHEADWEGMQITFTAATPEEALKTQPDEIVLFQHSGGEHANWDDSKVQKEGTHPVVYAAAGSHATFYSTALWLGNGQQGSGVGCDNTEKPVMAVRPKAILLPNYPVFRGRFAWLSFTGRWGQREAGFYNGPAGPNTKVVWKQPFTWMEATRSASPQVPGGSLMGPSVAGAFCSVVSHVTGWLNLASKTTPGALAIVLGFVLLIVIPISITKWRPVQIEPLHQTRALGQLLFSSVRMYWRHRGPLLLIAGSVLLLLGAVVGLEIVIRTVFHANGNTLSFGDRSTAVTVSLPGSIARTLATPVGEAVVIAFILNVDRHQDTSVISAWKLVARRVWRILIVQLLANVLVLLLFLSIIGIPYGVKKFVDWQFVQQEVIFEDRSIREAMRASRHVVRGHWWRTGFIAAALWVLSQIPGPVLGFALLFTSLPVETVNLIGSVVFALLVPYVEIGRTLLYFDVMERGARAPATAPVAVAPATG